MEDMEENEMMGKMRKRDTKKKKKKKNLPLQIFFSLSRGCLTSFQEEIFQKTNSYISDSRYQED